MLLICRAKLEVEARYILYQVYGDSKVYTQVEFSLLSFLPFIIQSNGLFKAVIYAENPEYFAEYSEYADVHHLDPVKLKEWMGPLNFNHRAKICLIQDFFSRYRGKLLYLDGDTYCMKDPDKVFQYIDGKEAVMHVNEGRINSEANAMFRKLYRFFKDMPVMQLENEMNINISGSLQMWNAGVIGMMTEQAKYLEDVRMTTDALYKEYPKHVMEQVAFSQVFQNAFIMRPAADYIYHYWDRRETMMPILYKFLDENKDKPLIDKALTAFELQPVPSLPEKRTFFQKLFGR